MKKIRNPWTLEQECLLGKMYREGKSAEEIAVAVDHPKKSVEGRICKMGIANRRKRQRTSPEQRLVSPEPGVIIHRLI